MQAVAVELPHVRPSVRWRSHTSQLTRKGVQRSSETPLWHLGLRMAAECFHHQVVGTYYDTDNSEGDLRRCIRNRNRRELTAENWSLAPGHRYPRWA